LISSLKASYSISDPIRLWFAFSGKPYKVIKPKEEVVEIDSLITRLVGQQLVIECKGSSWPLDNQIKPKHVEFETLDHKPITSKNYTSNGSQSSHPGVVGLTNLGNTCFMSAALQCLTKIPQIKDYFLNHDWRQEVNAENPLGMEGKLAQVFADLTRSIWSGKDAIVTPRDFKMIIGKFHQQFAGVLQQDSQEFLSFLMDGLHEDLNRIVKKPVVEQTRGGDRSDLEVATESWNNHLLRNNSVFTDKIQGQYKSTVVCPECRKVSITFDPYMSISLPFPAVQKRSIFVSFVSLGNKTPPIKYKIVVLKDALISDLREAISKVTKVPKGDLLIAEIYHSKVQKYWSDTHEVAGISHNDVIVAYEMSGIDEKIHSLPYSWKSDAVEPPFMSVRLYSLAPSSGNTLGVTVRGVPLNIAWNSQMTNKQLYDSVWDHMRRYLKNIEWTRFDFTDPTTLFPTDATFDKKSYDFFFTLRYETIVGSKIRTHEKLKYSDEMNDLHEHSEADKRVLTMMMPNNVFDKCVNMYEFDLEVLDTSCTTTEEGIKLSHCLNLFREGEKLTGDNSWYCSTCKKDVEALKKLEIWKLPDVLILHLKRFQVNARLGGLLEKVETPVDCPLEIDMKEFVELAKYEKVDTEYELVGVIDHKGTINYGHYIASAKVDDVWYNFDDTVTSKIDNPINSNAYVLFYVNKNAPKTSEIKGKIYPSKEQLEKMQSKMDGEERAKKMLNESKF
jgi:ubiquitin C-terminal hydrolase